MVVIPLLLVPLIQMLQPITVLNFFSSATADGSGNGEGETYLGFVNITTDGSGNANNQCCINRC